MFRIKHILLFMLSAICRKHLCFILFFIAFSCLLRSQDTISTDNIKPELQDTTNVQKETGNNQINYEMTKSPWGALWRSLILPGWGQLYVENYWKIPIFTGGIGVSVYFIIWNNDKYKFYQSQYDEMLQTDPDNTYELEKLKSQKEYYRDNRDKSYFLLGAVYVLAAIDAYVGAHLFDFDVDDNLQIRLMPYYTNYLNQFGLNLMFRIK